MIPRKLELKNFLSYGENMQTVDFSRHSLICLSGKNGNGKSALLDALTWVVWGQARKITAAVKPDEGLLRLGQSRMMVSLEFDFNQSIYRVRREFAKTYGKAQLALDFEVYDASSDRFFPLTEKTVRQTQEKIETTLGLDYETFINSAFLRQGQSNEFSKKSPRDRKIILANILGLSKYDKLQQAALEKVRYYNDAKKLHLQTEEQINAELEKEAALKAAQAENCKNLEILNSGAIQIQTQFQNNLEQKNKLAEQKKEFDQVAKETGIQQAKTDQKIAELRAVIKQWRNIQAKSLKLPDINKLELEKQTLQKKEQIFLDLRQESLKHQEEIIKNKEFYQKRLVMLESNFEKKLNELKLAIERSEFTSTQNKKIMQQKSAAIKDLSGKLDLMAKEQEQTSKKLNGKELFEQAANNIKAQFEKRRAFYQSCIDRGNFLKTEKVDLEERKTAIQDIHNPACPFCEQMLTAKRKQFLGTKLVKSEIFLNTRLTRITNIIKKLKVILVEQHKQILNIDKEFNLYKQLEAKFDDVTKKIEETKLGLADYKKELAELEVEESKTAFNLNKEKDMLTQQESDRLTHFAKDKELEDSAKKIAVLDQEVAKIKKKLFDYSEMQAQLKRVEASIQDYSQFRQEFDAQANRRLLITLLIKEVRELQKNIVLLTNRLNAITIDPNIESTLEKNIFELKKNIEEVAKQKETLTLQIGRADNELGRLEKLRVKAESRKDKLKQLDQEIEDYQFLASTFGKNGIQALLIEDAVPEIETEANRILAKLTDNQAQIFIESVRDLKSGGVKETMDIQISDAAGIRPYEMYSGGEAFRIDFALRIAISKLLANRAGTPLQTLIIDEGFGSQDEEGLTKVMSSILAIQEDFLKIIIVSHLSEFKDNFPIHFIIEKKLGGSEIKIEERG
ncbi:MAG: Exonuclease SbcC [candidate division TM6 bacterium GW2011_GWF2_37_49]|nr:MAG: Exonuclease SbcC [candidate division TM6 bacterium GW2011_GWF2_37_49]